MCQKHKNPSYLNDMFIAASSNYDIFGIRPGYYNLNSAHANLDINLSDILALKFWNLLAANLKIRTDNTLHVFRKELCDWSPTDEAAKVPRMVAL